MHLRLASTFSKVFNTLFGRHFFHHAASFFSKIARYSLKKTPCLTKKLSDQKCRKLSFRYFWGGLALLFFACGTPKAAFEIQRTKSSAPCEVSFKNTSKKCKDYYWDFGDGNTSTEKEPTHRYIESGNYLVKLRAKNGEKESHTTGVMPIAAPLECLVVLETPFGSMTIELFNETPLHRDNFLKLISEDFYQDLLFHRVINGFMMQGGDPNSKGAPLSQQIGTGEPPYKIDAEITNEHYHVKGALAAARDNNPEKASSGSQFYIVHGSPQSEEKLKKNALKKGIDYPAETMKNYLENGGAPQLDNEYTVFGQVIEGMDVIDKIAAQETVEADRPKENIWMRISIVY